MDHQTVRALRDIKALHEEGILTGDEYRVKKAELLQETAPKPKKGQLDVEDRGKEGVLVNGRGLSRARSKLKELGGTKTPNGYVFKAGTCDQLTASLSDYEVRLMNEKSVQVAGDAERIRAKMTALGGKWNAAKGRWIFPEKDRARILRELEEDSTMSVGPSNYQQITPRSFRMPWLCSCTSRDDELPSVLSPSVTRPIIRQCVEMSGTDQCEYFGLLTLSQVEIIRVTWDEIAKLDSAHVGASLFKHIFERAPEFTSLFKGIIKDPDFKVGDLKSNSEIVNHSTQVIETIGTVVSMLDYPAGLRFLDDLGRRHAKQYGVKEHHFEVVGLALIDMLKDFLHDAYTPAIGEAFQAMATTIGQRMIPQQRPYSFARVP